MIFINWYKYRIVIDININDVRMENEESEWLRLREDNFLESNLKEYNYDNIIIISMITNYGISMEFNQCFFLSRWQSRICLRALTNNARDVVKPSFVLENHYFRNILVWKLFLYKQKITWIKQGFDGTKYAVRDLNLVLNTEKSVAER